MLVLARVVNESVVIRTPEGREIKVVVTDIRGDKVRLGIDADREVTIHREEIQQIVDAERKGDVDA